MVPHPKVYKPGVRMEAIGKLKNTQKESVPKKNPEILPSVSMTSPEVRPAHLYVKQRKTIYMVSVQPAD